MSVDKYLEKMVLVPLERWEQILSDEKEIRQDSDISVSDDETDETPFPVNEESSSSIKRDMKDEDNKLAPPGIPSTNIIDSKEKVIVISGEVTVKPGYGWEKLCLRVK
jgi:trehalose-6-phosphatase